MRFIEAGRRNKKFSQERLAKEVRVDQAFISMIERGVALPTPDQAARIGKVLDIDPERLTDEVPLPQDPDLTPAETSRG